ncbi:nitroreductase [Alloscardovia criceti]|uniref:nitroreductase n=1 Tax=Alloscardovia criceti TaxID=356828 RepID=UPI00037A176F|nr:nitroreductase [Alloscardovia criceti]
MQFDEVVHSRHSVRDFSDKPVDTELLKEIVRTAQASPSWGNSQPVHVHILTGKAAQELRHIHLTSVEEHKQSHSDIAPMDRNRWPQWNQEVMAQWTVEFKKQFAPGQVHFSRAQKNLFNAPVFAFLTVPDKIFDWALFDAGAFANTLMLAAYDRGVDSIVAYSTVIFPDEIRALAHIPLNRKVVVGIALGYASADDINTFVPSRADVDDILTIISE